MINTIPASAFVSVNPGVVGAAGTGLELIGLCLTTSTRVPIGDIDSFSSALSVADFFGPSSLQAAQAAIYFAGFNNKNITPAAMLFVQYPVQAVPAYLRGGFAAGVPLSTLHAVTSGALSVVVDGVTWSTSTLNMSGDASYSAAATTITSALQAAPIETSAFTAAIAAETLSVTASINEYVLSVTVIGSGTVVPGAILAGSNVTTGTMVTGQLTGTAGGIGTYSVSKAQTIVSEAITGSYGLMTASAMTVGQIAVGQVITGAGVTPGTVVTGFDGGTGVEGTYYVSPSQTVSPAVPVTTTGSFPAVSFDSVSGAFIVTSGLTGSTSSVVSRRLAMSRISA